MASPASPRTVQPQGFTGCGDGVGGRLNFALGTPAGSVLRTNARRVAQPSAIKQDAQISFAGALNHFSLFDKVTALEGENAELKNQVEELKAALLAAQAQAQAAEEAAEEARARGGSRPSDDQEGPACGDAPSSPSALSKLELVVKVKSLQQELADAHRERRKAHNQLVELRGAIRVYCRVRPSPAGAPSSSVRLMPDNSTIGVSWQGSESLFSFSRVFGPATTQREVFSEVSELVQSSLDGYHVCLLSYGQTGSGKTHNMLGANSPDSKGIIPRAVEKLLSAVQALRMQGWTYSLDCSCMELYNDRLRDLLDPSSSTFINDMTAIKHDQNGGSHTVVQGVGSVALTDPNQAMAVLQRATQARAVQSTAMNAVSSRSHSVFMLNITGSHGPSGTKLTGSLVLVDLAGSERLDRSKAEGARRTEACSINSSLGALGDVFDALSKREKFVPYRNSKLTYLLKACLSPGGKTLFMVHVNPEDLSAYETLTSLRFATKVAGTELGAPAKRAINYSLPGGGPAPAAAQAPAPAPAPAAAPYAPVPPYATLPAGAGPGSTMPGSTLKRTAPAGGPAAGQGSRAPGTAAKRQERQAGAAGGRVSGGGSAAGAAAGAGAGAGRETAGAGGYGPGGGQLEPQMLLASCPGPLLGPGAAVAGMGAPVQANNRYQSVAASMSSLGPAPMEEEPQEWGWVPGAEACLGMAPDASGDGELDLRAALRRKRQQQQQQQLLQQQQQAAARMGMKENVATAGQPQLSQQQQQQQQLLMKKSKGTWY